ncbi:uncharacterized protein LOC112350147 [Selaginella moellendorffii]|uniref:uncharacterized protein LOC112350147 n=1 Tax=Selaginella moellendorffii TaxID=88036 RepID=UPI000D1C5DDA|nr:uncharacterized protein LOC112350147 [Selaginella moellendorffii]|eukprot:XP_024541604.1 uncharacterized protein LOC112350147 [Selaginella moellendorffii]
MKEVGWWTRNHGYKAWAVAIILLLAVWSMLSGSAGLGLARKWSAAAHTQTSRFLLAAMDHYHGGGGDEDELEAEMREKIVRHAWSGYRFGSKEDKSSGSFWQDAFEAAFEELESDKSTVSDGAVREIAKLSARLGAFGVDVNTGKPRSGKAKKQI